MTREEAINILNALKFILNNEQYTGEIEEELDIAIEALQQPNQFADGDKKEDHFREVTKKVDVISRQAAIDALEKVADLFPWRVPGKRDTYDSYNEAWNDAIGRAEMEIENLPSAQPQPEKYEYHYDHTDCIWYRPEARNRCPTTCAQYRDGWNDAMNYIFRDGKGYRPYRRDKQYGE